MLIVGGSSSVEATGDSARLATVVVGALPSREHDKPTTVMPNSKINGHDRSANLNMIEFPARRARAAATLKCDGPSTHKALHR
jgi:hypothetical protein